VERRGAGGVPQLISGPRHPGWLIPAQAGIEFSSSQPTPCGETGFLPPRQWRSGLLVGWWSKASAASPASSCHPTRMALPALLPPPLLPHRFTNWQRSGSC